MSTSSAPNEHGNLRLDQLPDVLKISEAAQVLRVGKRVVYEMIKRGEIGGVTRLGPKKIIRIPAASIRKLFK